MPDPFGPYSDPFGLPPGSPISSSSGSGGGSLLTEEERRWLARQATGESAPAYRYPYPSPISSGKGALRRGWDTATSPLRALAGLTGTSLVQLLGIPNRFPEQYGKAKRELEEDERGRGEIPGLSAAASLPGMGDVVAAGVPDALKESLAGRVLTPVGQIGLNILADPTTYVGAGLVTGAVKALGAGGKVAKAARVVESLGELGATGRAVRGAVKAPSAGALGRIGATLPFSPLVGLPYAPELLEGIAAGAGDAIEEARAGRYMEAAASGAGALLTTGLGLLVARGTMSEVEAARVAERALGRQTGDLDQFGDPLPTDGSVPGVGRQPGTPLEEEAPIVTPVARPGEEDMGYYPPPEQTGQAGVPPVEVPGSPIQGGGGVAPPTAAEAVVAPPPLPPAARAILATAQERMKGGGYLTREDVLTSLGLPYRRQKGAGDSVEAILTKHLGEAAPHVLGQIEFVSGRGYRVKEAPTAPAPDQATATAPAGAEGAPAVAPPAAAAQAEGAPTSPVRLGRKAIQAELDADPAARPAVQALLLNIAEGIGKPVSALTRVDIAKVVGGTDPIQHKQRAVLNHVLQQDLAAVKKAAQAPPEEVSPQPALTFPGEDRIPNRSIPTEKNVTAAGLLAEDRPKPTGIGEPPIPRSRPTPVLSTPQAVIEAREELEQVRAFVRERPELADEFGDREIELQDQIEEALRLGVGQPPTPTLERAPRPAQPEPAVVDEATRELKTREERTTPLPAGARGNPLTEREVIESFEPTRPATDREKKFKGAIKRHLEDEGVDPEVFNERAVRYLGRPIHEATPDQLSLLFTLAEKNPKAFGINPPSPLDSQLARIASSRLTGDGSHLETHRAAGGDDRDFRYDPASPAGEIQPYARTLASNYGVFMEDRLQDTLVKWLTNLERDDKRFLNEGAAKALKAKDAEEAQGIMARAMKRYQSAQNLRRLLLEPGDDAGKRKELVKLLRTDLRNGTIDFKRKGRAFPTRPVDDLVVASAKGRLSQEEQARLADQFDPERTEADDIIDDATTAAQKAALRFDLPPRPKEAADSTAWRSTILSDPPLLSRFQQSGVRLALDWQEGKNITPQLRALAENLGVPYKKGQGVDKNLPNILQAIGLKFSQRTIQKLKKSPSASLASHDLLTHQLVEQRGEVWEDRILKAPKIGDTGVRVVDLEGDAGQFVRPLTESGGPLANTLLRATANLSSLLDMPSTFGGFSPSPQLHGLRMGDDSLYLNPLAARHMAEAETAGRGLEGEAIRAAIAHVTARNLVDTLVHEIAHHKARHSSSLGDMKFTEAYSQAMLDLGPHYAEMVRTVRSSVEETFPKLTAILPAYRAAAAKLKSDVEARRGGGESGQPRADDRADQGGPQTSGDRPRGGAGGAVGGPEPGVRPIRPIPPGAGGEAPGAGGPAAAREGSPQGSLVTPGAEGRPGPLARERRRRALIGGKKGYAEQGYKYELPVKVTFSDGDVHYDFIKGMNSGHAMARAKENWDGAKIEVVGADDVERAIERDNAPQASLSSSLNDTLNTRRAQQVLGQVKANFEANLRRHAATPEDADNLISLIAVTSKAPPDVRKALREAKPQGQVDVGKNLTKIPLEGMSDEQREALGLALHMYNSTFSRAKPMTEAQVRAGMKRLLDYHTPEEFIDMAKAKGIRDPAEFALLDTLVSTFGRDVDIGIGAMRAAEIEINGARSSGNVLAIREAEEKLARAKDFTAHSQAKRDSALFTVIPESTRVARVMAHRRMMFHPLLPGETFKSRFLGAMRATGFKQEKADQFYQMLQETMDQGSAANWSNFINAFREATQPKWFDKFLEFWKAGLLGIPTQIVNVGTNTMYLGLRSIENAVSSLATYGLESLTGAPRTRFLGETSARMMGNRHGIAEAWDAIKGDLLEIAKLNPPDPTRRLAMGTFHDDPGFRQLYGAIEGRKGEFVRMPFKMLDAFDNFFKHITRNQEWAAQAHRLAQDPKRWTGSGEGVSHAAARIYNELREVARDPLTKQHLWKKDGYKAAIEAGRNASVNDTFQESLVGNPVRNAVRAWQQGTTQLPILQFFTPFVKTPYNIIAEWAKRSPLGVILAMKKYGRDDPAFVEAMVKSGIGSAAMMLMFEAALDGTVTGGGPTDPKEVEILKRTGWQPRSFKIGDQYISYQRLAPFSIGLGIAADMAEAFKAKDIATGAELMEKGVATITDNIMDQSFIAGFAGLSKVLTSPQKEGLAAIRSMQASLVPNIIGIVPFAHTARALDPVYRETEAFTLSPMQAQIPGLSQSLPAQYTPTGEVRERKGSPLERLLSPFMRSEVEEGPVAEAAAEIARVGPAISAPPPYFKIGQEKVYYTQEEREEIARAQEKAMEEVAKVIRRTSYMRLPDTEDLASGRERTKRDMIQDVITRYRRPVTERINKAAIRRARAEGGS